MISFINNLQDFQYGKEIVQTTTTYNEVGMLRVEKEDWIYAIETSIVIISWLV